MRRRQKNMLTTNIVTINSSKRFLELTKPLITAETDLLLENLVLLEIKSFNSIGTLSEIVELQKAEIINELASRN
jgi:hypothetical protein